VSSWSNPFASFTAAGAFAALCCLAACQSAPPAEEGAPHEVPVSAKAPTAPGTGSVGSAAAGAVPPGTAPVAGAVGGPAGAAPRPEEPIPDRAAQQYRQALDLLRSGRDADAELELKQLSVAYPQFAGPQLNLGLLYVKESKMTEAESALKAAVQINPANLQAGNELGIVERRLGKFADAEAAYQRTLAADPNYAPAHLNLGVLYDLYLAEPQKALDEFERYMEIAGQSKQVAGWVAELRKRVGAPAPKKEPV
jgi:tetratricopeptide (TPR) repeat protein